MLLPLIHPFIPSLSRHSLRLPLWRPHAPGTERVSSHPPLGNLMGWRGTDPEGETLRVTRGCRDMEEGNATAQCGEFVGQLVNLFIRIYPAPAARLGWHWGPRKESGTILSEHQLHAQLYAGELSLGPSFWEAGHSPMREMNLSPPVPSQSDQSCEGRSSGRDMVPGMGEPQGMERVQKRCQAQPEGSGRTSWRRAHTREFRLHLEDNMESLKAQDLWRNRARFVFSENDPGYCGKAGRRGEAGSRKADEMGAVIVQTVARSTDSLDGPGEGSVQPLPTAGGPSVKGKPGKRLSAPRGPFPRLADCAHFHYENVDFGHIQLLLSPDREGPSLSGENELVFGVQVTCQGRSWPVLRSYDDFRSLDAHLHRCIFDRRFSCLPELPPPPEGARAAQMLVPLLLQYLETLSGLVDSNLNCGPVLTWMELDNHGRRLLLSEEASLNIPAVAAAHVIKRYTAQAPDELSFEVGDIVSVIDMPPTEDRSWWRGKRGFQVGFFPSECVELFTERPGPGLKAADADGPPCGIPAPQGISSLTSAVPRPRGKLAGLLRTFMRSRPSRQRLRQRGILRQRVFGCDLGEHLSNSGQDVPQVLRCCSEFIEAHGVVDGIYRLSGVSSNIQRLRHEFDSERIPELSGPAFLQDIHSVSSLCKLYFRELPNPLLTYQLYGKFSEAMSVPGEEERLVRVHDVIQQLPPPHYRTLEYLLRHLARMARHSANTSMHARNLAIVWAPNLLRSMELESVGMGGAAAFREVRVQSVVVEFLLTHVDVLFSDTFTSAGLDPAAPPLRIPTSWPGRRSSFTPCSSWGRLGPWVHLGGGGRSPDLTPPRPRPDSPPCPGPQPSQDSARRRALWPEVTEARAAALAGCRELPPHQLVPPRPPPTCLLPACSRLIRPGPLPCQPGPLPAPQAQVPCGQLPLHPPADAGGSPGTHPGPAGDAHGAHNSQGPGLTCGKEERGERGETAEARGQQLEDVLCTGPGPQCPSKEAPALAGGHPCPTAAFRQQTRHRHTEICQERGVSVIAGQRGWPPEAAQAAATPLQQRRFPCGPSTCWLLREPVLILLLRVLLLRVLLFIL
ncbi:rho GTPase-activating protein 33 isoform X23 [Pongo pygmaeus]|uniref:rho GTPase-activating protein 33 isoform X23 n=1 Tax=Pongo pygmaeus TaxID=9600 RepID=UPI0023E28471|nr:rho GTPase-activating protein 33 isoform X28 [Pongo pygmaeus]